ncbi:MAG: tetratricopeptide repeat protein [Bryobacteraceae bacterium]
MLNPGRIGGFAYDRWFQHTAWDDTAWLAGAYWKRIAALALIGLAAGAAYARWHPEEYVSRATVRFIPPQVGQTYVASNMAMQVEQRIFAVTQLVNSRLTATQLIESFNLYPQKRLLYPIADLLPEFQSSLRLTADVGADNNKTIPSIIISFRYAEAAKAQQVVQRIVELIYEESRRYRSDQSIGTTDFLQQELKTVTEQMDELEGRLAALPTPGGEDKEYRNILKVEQLHDLERRLTDLQHNMNYVRGDLNQRTTLVETLEDQLSARSKLGDRKPITPSAATQSLRVMAIQAADRYTELRRRYPANNNEVKAAEQAMLKNRQALDEQEKLDRDVDLAQDLAVLNPQLMRARAEQAGFQETLNKELREESTLGSQIQELRAQFTVTPQAEDQRLQAMREYEVAKIHYAELTRRQRESQLSSDMERRGHGETAELVEPPTMPRRPEYPQNWMVLAGGSLLGAFTGFFLALLNFLDRPVVRIARHAEMLGGIPVLTSLPEGRPLRKTAPSSASLAMPHILGLLLAVSLVLSGCSLSGKAKASQEFASGQKAAKAGNYRGAEIFFRRALQIDHRYGEAYLGLADAYEAEGRPGEAYENLVRAGELLPGRPQLIERLGEFTYRLYFSDPGRPAALLREVEQRAAKLMKSWPERPSGYRLSAQVLLESHRSADAIKLMEQALEKLEDGSLRTQLAAAYFQAGDREAAERHLRTSIEKNPKHTPGFDLLYLQLMESGKLEAARAVLLQKVQITGGLDAGLQLAAHDDASGARELAEQSLRNLETSYRKDPETYARIGDFWLHRDEINKARQWYEAGATAHPQSAGLFAGRKAELLMAEKKPDAARSLVDSELQSRPNDPLMRAYQAALNINGSSANERKRMQSQLESVLAQMPNSSFVRLHLGRAYLLNGDVLRAGEQLRSAVSLDPNYAPGWLALAELDLNMGESATAQERLTALLRRAPGYAPAQLLQAQASLALNKPGDAEAALESLHRADPQNTDVILTLARAKVSLGNRAQAFQLLDQAAKLQPTEPRPVMLQARMEIDGGNPAAALTRLRAAQAQMGNQPELASMLGSVALLAKDPKTALQQFQALLKASPENLEYRLGYATSLALTGDKKHAQEQYEWVQKKAGGNPQPWLLYGSLMSSSGNRAAAIAAYEEAIRRDAKNPYALNNLAFLLAREGKDLKKALQLAEEARRVLPRSREINDTLAYVYLLLDMRRNALSALEELANDGPSTQRQRSRNLIAQINSGNLLAARTEIERGSDELDGGDGL